MDFSLTEEQEDFRRFVHDWVESQAPKSAAREWERQDDYPHELWDRLSSAGFHGIGIDEAYGGQGGDVTTQVILARELGRSLAGLTWTWGAPSFAGGKAIGEIGTEDQKQRFLPRLAAGLDHWSIGFTEPGGGTDMVGGLRTKARRVEGGWRLTGQKTWCTAAGVADRFLVLARTSEPPGDKRHRGLTMFLMPGKTEGVTVTRIHKLGFRSLGAFDVFMDDVFVSDEDVLGEVDNAFYALLPTLNNERIILAALCTGIIDGVLEDAVRYATEREAFGGPIGRFQAIQHYVADIAVWQAQSELLTYKAAAVGDAAPYESNVAKLVASENANKAADLGLQILGGMGYSAETDMQRYWRDARLFKLAPVSNEMVRNGIAESFGLPRSY